MKNEDLIAKIHEMGNLFRQYAQQLKEDFTLDWIDPSPVMRQLHVNARTLHNWHKAGILCYSTIGGKRYYKLSDIHELLEKNKGKGSRNRDNDEGMDKEE